MLRSDDYGTFSIRQGYYTTKPLEAVCGENGRLELWGCYMSSNTGYVQIIVNNFPN